jgi:hypothetical protein
MNASSATPTFVLIPGMGATSFIWTPLVRELALRGHRALPVELPGHGFDAVFPAGYQCPQDTEKLATAPSPVAALTLEDYVAHTLQIVRRVAVHGPVVRTNPRIADPQLLATQHALFMADLDPTLVPAVLNYALQPDESLRAVLADAQVNPATWAALPRTYIRTTHDRVLPPAVQDRMIAEADALAPTNPFDVYRLDTSHVAPITRPAEIADILTATFAAARTGTQALAN